MTMIKELIILSLKTKIRSAEYRRNLLAFGVLILYFSVLLFGYIGKSFSILDSLLSAYRISFFALFLKTFPFLLLIELIVKIIFKNSSLYISQFIQTRPVSKKDRNIYTTLANVFSGWNCYLFIFFLPYLIRFATTNETLIVFVLLWVGSTLNNGICLWLKNYGSRLPVKTLLVGIFYLALLGAIYFFIRNNQSANFTIVGVAFIILLAIFTIVLYFYLFKQKKVYIVENLVKQRVKLNQQEITLSFLKMELIYVLRSKRLLLMSLLPTIILLAGISMMEGDIIYIQFLMILLLILPVMNLGQYILAIEANFFNGIWTKPVSLTQLLETKYIFHMMLTGIYAAILFPFVLYYHISILIFFSMVFYILFIFNLLLFPIALYSKRLALNYIAFGNTQGFAIIPVIYQVFILYISFLFLKFLYAKISNEWVLFGVVLVISAIFFFLRKWFLSIIVSIFIKQRHKIMHRYMSS